MNRKPATSDDPALRAGGRSEPEAKRRRRAAPELRDFHSQRELHPMMVELYRRAAARLRNRQRTQRSKAGVPKSAGDPQRLLHELEVHQIELEMQNAELQKARDELEAALEKYTDLYDFAPVGYFSIDESGAILEANLTGAALLGVERSRLINRRLLLFVSPTSRPVFLEFLKEVFTGPEDQVCEALLLKEGGGTFWAGFRASACEITSATSPGPARRSISQAKSVVSLSPREIASAAGPAASAPPVSRGKGAQKWCRVAFGDITARKQAEEAQRSLEALADTNRGLNREIARRQAVEKALQKSEQHQSRLLRQSGHMQEQLRHLSHQILHAQEEERKRISRELHDEIAQTLVGINVHLAALTREAAGNPRGLQQQIARTQRLVEKSVDIVHRFARELRPTMLDDLGLIPALHAFMQEFTKLTGIHIRFTTFSSSRIKQLNNATRTVFYRVAQEALTNVARHAQASLVEVNFEKLPNAICLKIKDNGKSFQAEHVMQCKRNTRLGLVGMRERLEMVGGSFSVESASGKGTTITAHIPLGKASAGGGNSLMEPAGTKLESL
jgi:PAS domain S-box-containing protein